MVFQWHIISDTVNAHYPIYRQPAYSPLKIILKITGESDGLALKHKTTKNLGRSFPRFYCIFIEREGLFQIRASDLEKDLLIFSVLVGWTWLPTESVFMRLSHFLEHIQDIFFCKPQNISQLSNSLRDIFRLKEKEETGVYLSLLRARRLFRVFLFRNSPKRTPFFWDYSGIGILGIDGILCSFGGYSVFRMNGLSFCSFCSR